MDNTVSIQGSVQISNDAGQVGVQKQVTITPTGDAYFAQVQAVGTTTETLAIGDCASLSMVGIYNPSTTGTLTVTCESILVKPGKIAIFQPSSTSVTLIATESITDIAASGAEE